MLYSVQTLLSSRLLSNNLKIKKFKTLVLPLVLYGCETWPLTLREESRLRLFENRILRRIFGPEKDENGEWRSLHNEELHSLYRSPNIFRVIKSRSLRWVLFRFLTNSPCHTGELGRKWLKSQLSPLENI